MREILFRGKRKVNGEWVEGSFLRLNIGQDFICDGTVWIGTLQPVRYDVDPKTVGQYTGLTDKNGKKIFEGDILLYGGAQKVVVSFEYGQFVINHYAINLLRSRNADSEVIGNIHDDPELLEGAQADDR